MTDADPTPFPLLEMMMTTTTKTTYVLCADVSGRAYYVSHISGILPGNVYTSMPCDAKKFPNKRSATAAARRLNAGRTQHWVEQIEDGAN